MVKAKLSPKELKRTINEFRKILEEHNIKVTYLILFGSYSRKTPRDYSDIDLAIISPDFRGKNRFRIQEIIARSLAHRSGTTVLIEPIGFSPEEYKNTERVSFLGEIKSTGKLIKP